MELKEIEGIKYIKFDSNFEVFRYRFGIFVNIFLILFLLCFGSFTTYYLIHNKEAFYGNPFIYGAKRMDASCTCFTTKGLGIPFMFNATSFGQYISSPSGNKYEEINITELEKSFIKNE